MEKKFVVPQQSIGTKIWLFFLDIAQTFLITGAVFFVITYFLFRPFQVSGNSMYSTYKDKEYIITNLITLRFNDPKPGDVIVFKSPTDPTRDFIKRVIATAGDTVYLKDGYVYVNDKKLTESYLNEGVRTIGGAFLQEGEKKVVPPGYFFVMGDNRSDSSDSRQWGFVSRQSIKGISVLVYWPLDSAHIIKNPYTQ
jgi:signal peptidase I